MDFIEMCQDLGVDYVEDDHEHCREGWVQIDCPYCSPDWQHYRMGYNLAGRYVSCWACGPHNLVDSLLKASGVGFGKIKPYIEELPREAGLEKVARGNLTIPKGVGPLLKPHRRYLEGRGFDPDELVRLWGIGGIGQTAPKLRWRLYIPIYYRGNVVSWTTRHLRSDHEGRYRSASPQEESINHKELLYGEDYVRHSVVICEGPTDVWRIGVGSVCTFGTGVSRSQLARIASLPIRVVAFDSESFAQKKAIELCDQLSVFPGKTYNVELSGKDAASSKKREIKSLRERFLTPYMGVPNGNH